MTIFTQEGYDPGDNPAGVPLIGYDNKISAVSASSEDTDAPALNLLNAATHLTWRATDVGVQVISLETDGACDYLAIARHNLADTGAKIGINTSSDSSATGGFMSLLLHCEGTNGSTVFNDSSGNDAGASVSGAVTISTAQFKFGAASASFAGGHLIIASTQVNFGTSDFTVDFWLRINATGVVYTLFDSGGTTTGVSLRKNAANQLVFKASNVDRITGATALTTGTWYHVAVTRSNGSTKLFLNGAQQGSTYADSNSYVAVSAPTIGSTVAGAETLNGFMDEIRVLNGRAAWTAAFAVPTMAYSGLTTVIGDLGLLLHFDGTDASTTITDSGGQDHVFTALGNAQLDTAQFKFGTASLLLDGTGDYIQGDGSDEFALGTGEFTIDFWVRFNTAGTQVVLYDSRPIGFSTGPYVTIYRNASNQIVFYANGANRITGTTAWPTGSFIHFALTRQAGATQLWGNGVQEGSPYADTNDYANATNRPVMGVDGSTLGSGVNGWIDEVRIVKGLALWTQPFNVPTRAAGTEATVGRMIPIDSALPIIFRFPSTTDFFSLTIGSGSDVAELAVIYAGTLLVLERSVKVDVQHLNVIHARKSNVLAGMSEAGNFLGRVLVAEWRESQADFAWFTPDWYRTNFEPFAEAAMTEPFFWVWNPDEYPDETAFAWITDDIRPETDPATRRVAATIVMRAIA